MGKSCSKCRYIAPGGPAGYGLACPKCGAPYPLAESDAPVPPAETVTATLAEKRRPTTDIGLPATALSTRQWLAVGGGAALMIGAFLPLIRVPIVGSISYLNNGRGDGWALILLGAVTAWAAVSGRYKLLWWTGGLSTALIVYGFYRVQSIIGTMQSDLANNLKDNPFAGLATAFAAGVQMEFGWAVLVIGAALVLMAAWNRPLIRK